MRKEIKQSLLYKAGKLIRTIFKYYTPVLKDDKRDITTYKLVYFAGSISIQYLNASLHSVYKNWKFIPEVVVISDGTSKEIFRKYMTKWPRKVEIIDWTICAEYFEEKGNSQLSNYAVKELWGKKFIGIMYCFENWKTLYSDTDVLWLNDPTSSLNIEATAPFIKMSQDIEPCYSQKMIEYLDEQSLDQVPLNAGVIFGSGDFSSLIKWERLCNYLNDKPDNRTEQTAFAILTKYFGSSWTMDEIFLGVDDINTLFSKYFTRYSSILARHYVNTKQWLFWRDYLTMCFKKKHR